MFTMGRPISSDAVVVVAALPPIELLARQRIKIQWELERKDAYSRLMERWQDKWAESFNAAWTRRLLPEVQPWVEQGFGEVGYEGTQFLTDHSYFKVYLKWFKISETDPCSYC